MGKPEIVLVRPEDTLAPGESVTVPQKTENAEQGIQGRIAYIIDVVGDKLVVLTGIDRHTIEREQLTGGRRHNPPPPQAEEKRAE